jgi:hypothetical protein
MKGVGQTEYEMIFDPRGKLTKTNAPDPDFVKKDYISRLNPEAIEYRQKKMAERAEMDGSGLEIRIEDDVKSAGKKKSKDVEIDVPESLDIAVTPKEVLDAFKKKFPRVKDEVWSQEAENYVASFENRGIQTQICYKPDGMMMTKTIDMQKDRYPRKIIEDLNQRYPGAKIEKFQKVEYDIKYRNTVTDRKLETYFYIELSEKIKGKKDRKYIKLTYDKSYRYQGLAGSTDEYED